MAMTFSNGGVYEVTIIGEYDDAIECNLVHHLQLQTGGVLSQALGLDDIEDWVNAVITVMKALQAAIMVWKEFSVAALEGTNSTGRIPIIPQAGTNASPALPSGAAALVYMNTDDRSRQLRKYFPGLGEDRTGTNGEFGAGVATQLLNLGPLYLLNYVGNNGTWAYGHYRTGVPGSFVRPQTMTVQNVVSYQRRRRRGRGV